MCRILYLQLDFQNTAVEYLKSFNLFPGFDLSCIIQSLKSRIELGQDLSDFHIFLYMGYSSSFSSSFNNFVED